MSDNGSYLSKKTKRGVLILVVICLCIIYTPRFLDWAKPAQKLKLTHTQLAQVERLNSNKLRADYQRKNTFVKKSKFKRPQKKFNPNDYSKDDWTRLGLSVKQVDVILKFAKQGLQSNDDLKKIFVISEPLFLLIKDSTFYPENSLTKNGKERSKFSKKKLEKVAEKIILVELNTADLSELESIPGIGPFFAKMIVKKRTELGGFFVKEQLQEVYKMEGEKYLEIEKYFRVNPQIISKININEAAIDELRKHPYIEYKVANSIVMMRQQKGTYNSIDELKESVLINPELFQKLKPYVYL